MLWFLLFNIFNIAKRTNSINNADPQAIAANGFPPPAPININEINVVINPINLPIKLDQKKNQKLNLTEPQTKHNKSSGNTGNNTVKK